MVTVHHLLNLIATNQVNHHTSHLVSMESDAVVTVGDHSHQVVHH